mgnify:CR=1 FL=1
MPDLLNLQLDENDVELIVELLQNAPHLWAQQLADDIREQTGDLVLDENDFFDAGVQAREQQVSASTDDSAWKRANDPIDW